VGIKALRRVRDRMLGRMDAHYYRSLGMQIGDDVHIGPDCRLDPSTAWMITIGDSVVIAPGVQVIAHDASLRRRTGFTKVQPVVIGSRVFIGAGTLVLPGVTIGNDVVIGAGSLVARDIPDGSLAVGRPAEVVMPLAEFEARERDLLEEGPRYNEDTPGRLLTMTERESMRREIFPGTFGWSS
jgi:maltose O-acetyltransferase